MRRPTILSGALIGGLVSLPLIALSYLGARLAGLPFIAFDLFEWLARVLPGRLVIGSIEGMVKAIRFLNLGPLSSTAKLLEQGMGIMSLVVACVVIGALLAFALRRGAGPAWWIGLLAGLVMLLGFAVVELTLDGFSTGVLLALVWVALLVIGWAITVSYLLSVEPADSPIVSAAAAGASSAAPVAATPAAVSPSEARPTSQAAPGNVPASGAPLGSSTRLSRRAFLARVAGGAAGLSVVALGAAQALGAQSPATPATLPNTGAEPATALQPATAPPAAPAQAAATTAPSALPAAALNAATPLPAGTGVASLRDLIAPAPGTRSELTPNAEFYRIDIDLLPPNIEEATWFVDTTGLFETAAQAEAGRSQGLSAGHPDDHAELHLEPGRRRPDRHQQLDRRPPPRRAQEPGPQA